MGCIYSKIKVLFIFALLMTATSSFGQCEITNLTFSQSACTDSDLFDAEINFDYANVGEMGFQILGNGNNYGIFSYDDLPITIEELSGDCTTPYEFIARDVEDPTCSAFIEVGIVCCEDCELTITTFEIGECDGNSYVLTVDMENTGSGDSYSAELNGMTLGTYQYTDLPQEIIIDPDGEIINSISFCDVDNPECCVSESTLNPCTCAIENVTSEIVECDETEGTFYVLLDFDFSGNADSFLLGNTSNFLGTFAYADLPVLAGPLTFSDETYEILILDQNDPFCFSAAYLGIVQDCNINCQIFNTFAEAYMCEDGTYFMDLEFETEDIEGNSFEVFVDDISYGIFPYGDPFFTIGPIPSDCSTPPTLVVQDLMNEVCSDFFNFSEPICCPGECMISEVFAEAYECDEETFLVDITFDYSGIVSDSFEIRGNGMSYGFFAYGEEFYTIGPLDGDCETIYEFIIIDQGDNSCTADYGFEEPICCGEEECSISDVVAEANDCEDNLFYVDVAFEYSGAVSDSFEIRGNGMSYGFFAYGESFYTVGPLEGDCETIYEFIIIDQGDNTCTADYGFDEPICCDSEECSITNVFAEALDCVGELVLIDIEFDYTGEIADSFEIRGNGTSYGFFTYGAPSYTVGPIIADCETLYEFIIIDNGNNECTGEFVFDEPLCCNGDCDIRDVTTDVIECIESEYFIELDFIYEGTSNIFNILIGDTIYTTASFNELPLGLGPFPTGEEIDIFIVDGANINCNALTTIFVDECETGVIDDLFLPISIANKIDGILISGLNDQIMGIQIIHTNGSIINEITETDYQYFQSMANHPSGVYFVRLRTINYSKTYKVAWISN